MLVYRLRGVEDELPTWWRMYWALATLAVLAMLIIGDGYAMILPSLVGLYAACFGFEYLVEHQTRPPSD